MCNTQATELARKSAFSNVGLNGPSRGPISNELTTIAAKLQYQVDHGGLIATRYAQECRRTDYLL